MKTLESIVSSRNNEELEQAFNEIVEWRTTGILTDGVVRRCHREFQETQSTFPVHAMENAILFEIAKRMYAKEQQ